MPKWISIPPEKIFHQNDQLAFLEARRQRKCKVCKTAFSVVGANNTCPQCKAIPDPKLGDNNPIARLFNSLIIIAGRRYGKTRFGSIAAVEEACIPNTIGWACAPTNPKLHRYVIPAFQQLIPPDWVADWSSEFNDLRLTNGSLIHFQTLEDPDQGRGQGLDWLWVDEICELTLKHWEVIRPSLADRQGVAFFTTSPRSYDWVYEEIYRPAEEGRPGFWGLHARSDQNPTMSLEYLAQERASMSEAMYRQEYEADFVNFTGAIYGESLHNHHILRTDDDVRKIVPEWPEINKDRQVLIGLDTGADHPFGAVKLLSTEKGMLVVGEYLERNKSFIQHAQALHRLTDGLSTRWAINKNEKQPLIELAQHGITAYKAENDQVAGIERVKSWLHANQLYFVERLCPSTIKQMKAYRWAENTSPKDSSKKEREKAYKKDDELPDCLRYALMTWPLLPKVVEPTKERNLEHLPGEIRASIERMRRIDAPTSTVSDDVGDFWL